MICKNCQKEIKDNAKFCNFCGLKVEQENNKLGFRQIVLNLFDLRKKKNFIESIILCVIVIGFILPIYFLVPAVDGSSLYLLNGFICFVFSLALTLFKKDKLWYLWSLLSAFTGYWFGMFYGVAVMMIPFMRQGDIKISDIGQIEKQYIFSFYKSGVLLYLFGSIATIISFANPDESGTYTIFYGAVMWGLVKIFQGIYYQSKPELILNKINEYYEKNGEYPKKNNAFNISPGFKKFLVYFFIIIILIIIIGILNGL